jgi:predicted NBD/HSP70 family sugar kinase
MTQLTEPITERRRLTRNTVYRYLYNADAPRAKQEIAKALSLSLPTVYQNLKELMEAGLVCYGGVQRSTGGRRAMGYTIDAGARYAIGISITGERMRILAADLRLRAIAYKKTRPMTRDQARQIGDVVHRELEKFLDENNLDRTRLLGVGVALPAVIDPERDAIVLGPMLKQLGDISIPDIKEKIGYPCFAENDGTCGGHAEWFMQGEKESIAYLSMEDGVGGAVLLEGAPYVGTNRRSGEFGHICVEPGGKLCKCGKKGCLEAYVSAQSLSTDLGMTLETFFARLKRGDEACCRQWEEFMRHLAIGINSIRMTLDCDVVLGGFLSQYLAPWLPDLKERVAALNPFGNDAEYIRMGKDPRYAVVRGAALHYIQDFLDQL